MVFEGRATTQTKRFFFVNHFLKRYKLLVFLTKMVFLKRYKVFRRKTCVVALPSFSTFLLENLCRGPPFLFTPFPRKGAGKGYQVRKLPLFTPF